MFRLPFLQIVMLCTTATYIAPANFVAEKIIVISVNEKSEVSIDRIVFDIEVLPRELQQRLWRSFVSTGIMPSSIHLKFEAHVPETTRSLALDGIKQAQEKTLNVLCLHKYKKKYESISSRRKERLKKQFPVLFQRDFSQITQISQIE